MVENDKKELQQNNAAWKDIVNRMPGGLGVYYVYPDDRVELAYLNDTFYTIMDSTREERSAYTGFDTFDSVQEDDRRSLVAQLQLAVQGIAEVNLDIRVLMKTGEYRWLNVRATVAEQLPDKTAMYLLFTNVDELHRDRLLAEDSRNIIQIASQSGNMALWVYHLDTHHISQSFANNSHYGLPTEITGGYEDVIRAGGIHADDIEAYRAMYQNIDDGAETGECTIRICYIDEGRYEWRHMVLSRSANETDGPIAIGFGVNVDLQKEAEIRYARETNLRKDLLKDAVAYYRINLNNHLVEEIHSDFMDTETLEIPVSMEDLLEKGLLDGCYPEDYQKLAAALDLNTLLQNYRNGKITDTLTYRRYLPGKGLRWLKATITKLKRVNTDEVIAFFTAVDIDDERKDQILYRDVLNEEVESLITMKVATRQIRILKENLSLPNCEEDKKTTGYFAWTKEFREGLFQDMLSEDRDQASDFLSTDSILRGLEKVPVLQGTYRTCAADGTIRRKKLRVFYLDESKQDIIYVRRDITDLYNEQQRQSAVLKRAIDDAKAANEAKSIFFSRMSHDMRTPLNAIIGYSGPELRDGASETQKDEFLDDIHASGTYLLGIINDVLDMSKIESNKMVLHPEPYAFHDFKLNVETVIQPLCNNKKIEFEIHAPIDQDVIVMLDRVRFNQIFINILSNAVKFTPEGGKIILSVCCLQQEGSRYDMEFQVTDNGCGMSPEFIPHAFDSFSQDYTGQSMHKEQGTGLGLSIVKQLVELMGGVISVESVLGKGSTFIIRMPFTVAGTADKQTETNVPKNGLVGIRVLLCEDHPMNRKIAVRLLEKEGCIVETAEDGAAGVRLFRESALHYYDAVFMDIRMPNMDGLEASRTIRALTREDAGQVPIIAMTANAFVEDRRESLEAGMDAHISKPIEPAEMYRILYQLSSSRHVSRAPKILVVDDIEMNAAIVARVLKGHYETTIVLSGEEALEQLKADPYIIAVITDVQMPGMDGGELIRTIRRDPAYNRIALIANTQFGNSRIEEEIMHDGADDFIYKPTAPSVILSRVDNVLGKYR